MSLAPCFQVVNCYWLLLQMLDFAAGGNKPTTLFPIGFSQSEPVGTDAPLPKRRDDINFTEYSAVLGKPLEVSRWSLHHTERFSGSIFFLPTNM